MGGDADHVGHRTHPVEGRGGAVFELELQRPADHLLAEGEGELTRKHFETGEYRLFLVRGTVVGRGCGTEDGREAQMARLGCGGRPRLGLRHPGFSR